MDELPGSQPLSQANDLTVDGLDYDPELDEAMSVPGLAERDAARPRRSGLLIATVVGAVAIAGGLGAFALSLGGKGGTDAPVLVKADNAPIKVKPENPGGTVVPNQDNKVYDAVAKGTKPAEPVQQKLVTNTEEPVDVIAKEPQSRVVDLSPDDTGAAAATDAAGNAANDNTAPGNADATGNADVAAAPKSEDRIAQVLQDADNATNPEVVAVAPRKVRTMLVKADGSLVPREDPAPAAPQVAAAEPVDPAPQRVPPTAQADAEQTATVPPVAEEARADQANADQANADQAGADQATTDQASADQASAGETEMASTAKPVVAAKPAEAAKAEANTQSANTPTKVPVAPQRPSEQPVDVVGEVKPDQVASIDPATACDRRRLMVDADRFAADARARAVHLSGSAAPLWQRAHRPRRQHRQGRDRRQGNVLARPGSGAEPQRCDQPVRELQGRRRQLLRIAVDVPKPIESRRGHRPRRFFVLAERRGVRPHAVRCDSHRATF